MSSLPCSSSEPVIIGPVGSYIHRSSQVWNLKYMQETELKLSLNKYFHLTLWPWSPFSPFSPRGPGFPWEKEKQCQPVIKQLDHIQKESGLMRAHGVIRSAQWNQELRGCRRNRCRCTPGQGSSPHLSDTHIKNKRDWISLKYQQFDLFLLNQGLTRAKQWKALK